MQATGTRAGARRRLVALAALLLALTLLPPLATANDPTTLRIGHVGHGSGAIHAGAERFARHLAEASGGRMVVDIVGRAALGGIGDMWVQMRAGALDMQVIDVPAISMIAAAKRVHALLTPFLFESQDHMRRYFASAHARELLEDIAASTSIRYVGYVSERSPRVISTTTHPVLSVADIDGMKMRVPPHPVFIDIFRRWGSVPTPVPPVDMFMALKSGLVEGEDNGIVNLANGPNAAVIRHVSPIDWSRTVVGLWIGEARWEALTDQERTWVEDAARLSEAEAASAFDADMRSGREKLDKLGIEVHEPELAGFRAIVDAFVDEREGTDWPDGEIARIRALR